MILNTGECGSLLEKLLVISCHQKFFFFNIKLTCDGSSSSVLFQISWHLQTQIVKNRILSYSLLGILL